MRWWTNPSLQRESTCEWMVDVQVRSEVYPWKRDSITLSTMDLKHSIYYLNKLSANLFILAKYTQFCWVSNLSRLSTYKCSYNTHNTKQGIHLMLVQVKLMRNWSLYFYFYFHSIFTSCIRLTLNRWSNFVLRQLRLIRLSFQFIWQILMLTS